MPANPSRTPVERRFRAYGQELAGLQWPGEGEPVLALHGWLDNAASFQPLAEPLGHPLVALDFAGHGHSEHRPRHQATHYVDHVRDVLAVADQLGWDRFVLVGHSMGAGVACLFAATFPERVSRLVLIEGLGPPATAADEVAPNLRKAIDQMQALPDKRKPVYADPSRRWRRGCRPWAAWRKARPGCCASAGWSRWTAAGPGAPTRGCASPRHCGSPTTR